jgi:hypothetical protein
MISLVRIVLALLSEAVRLVLLLVRPSVEIRVENLVLRKQLAQTIERRVKPRRVDALTRISLALLTRLFDWHNAVVIRACANGPPLAPRGMAIVLAIQVQIGLAADSGRAVCADSENGSREPAVGRRAHRQ